MTIRTSSAVLVGRDAELAQLTDALKRARSGDAAAVLVGGEAGAGKTRLVEEFCAGARADGVRVLVGRCLELGEEGLPFAPFAGALREVLRQDGPASFAGQEQDLARLLPELGPAGPQTRADLGRGQLFDLVAGLFERLAAERPLVLVVEDLHWADRSTRDLVGFLLRSGRGGRAILVATYRSDELHRGHPLRPFLAELDRVRSVERLELDRLDRDATAAILTDLRGTAPTACTLDNIYARSQGNAFFIEELAACPDDSGSLPDTLRDLLLARVDLLPDSTQQVLRIAAAGGQRIGHRLLTEVAGVSELELDAALRGAVTAQLVVADADGDGYEFRHALVREAVHDDLLPGEHARLHARYAAAIEADPALVGASRAPAEIAHHWYSAHDHPRALAAAFAAAHAAGERYAFAEQQRLLERVLELWERVPAEARPAGTDRLAVLERAVIAAIGTSDFARGLALTKAGLAEADVEPLRAARLLEQRAKVLRLLGKRDGLDEWRRAYDLVIDLPASARKAQVLAGVASGLMRDGDPAEVDRAVRAALAIAEEVGDVGGQVSATVTYGMLCNNRLDPETGLVAMHRAAALATEAGDLDGLARAELNLSNVLFELGRYAESAAAAPVSGGEARRVGVGHSIGVYRVGNHAEALLALGRWDEASDLLDQVMRLDPPGNVALIGLLRQGELELARGTASAQETVGRAAGYLTRPYLEAQLRLPVLRLRILAQLEQGPAGAVDAARAVLDDVDVTREPRYGWPALAAVAEALSAGAEELRGPLAELAAATPVRYPPERAYAADVAAALAGPGELRAARLAAVEAWRADGQPYPTARALLRLAEAEAAAGDRAAAADTIEAASVLAGELGAGPLQLAAATLARRIGVRAATPLAAAPGFALTSREREVLRLVAEGYSNGRIAEALYISPKTASVHVSRIIAKLEVTSRGEAAALAHRLGLLEAG